MKVGIFTCYDKYHPSFVFDEFIEKNLSFVTLLPIETEFVFISFGNLEYSDSIKSFFDENNRHVEIRTIELNESLTQYLLMKTFIPITTNVLNDLDIIYTYGNFINFELNNMSNKHNLSQRDILKIQCDYDTTARYYFIYKEMCRLLNITTCTQLQFMSDPLDLLYPSTEKLTPDIKDSSEWNYFPLYQYYHIHFTEKIKREKSIPFIVGNTLFDNYRRTLFAKYLLPFVLNGDYSDIYYSGGHSLNVDIKHNYMIPHKEFFNKISESITGLVLNTYAQTIISSNKFFAFIANDCIPLISFNADKTSRLIPDEIKSLIEVKDIFQLKEKIENPPNVLPILKEYFSMEFDREQCSYNIIKFF